MNTYHDRYARFGVLIGILAGVAIIAIAGLFFPRPEPKLLAPVQYGSLDTYELSDNGYIGWGNENPDWCDQFFNFSHDGIQVTGQVSDDRIEIFIRDKDTGEMARIAGDSVGDLRLEIQ